ncbi:MAG: ACT domain-containing protein [Acidaminobacter sp.]|nr:ACT domain-containing protein [Acidaminobacter sp.]
MTLDKSKFIILSVEAVPEVYVKVLEAKELLKNGTFEGVTDAVKAVGISRSTYYKYCDHVFPLAEGAMGKRITISLLLSHESGVLSQFLQTIAEKNCNVMTISQDAPINGIANASITFDISEIQCTFDELIETLRSSKGVKKMNIVAIE